jgi:hypothetical protein
MPELKNVKVNTRVVGVVAVVAGTVALGALALAACSHLTGPPLSASIESQQLVPTSDFPDATALCCCRVRGTVRNTSSITAHISLRFHATNVEGQDVGTAMDYLVSVPAGESRAYDAAGIFEACSRVSSVTPDVLVVGLFEAQSQ